MGKEIISNELRASIRDAIGSKVKVEQIQSVLLELKADKFEPRVLLLSKHRCYIAIPKIPVKIENNFHFLEVSSLESKSQKKLTVHLPEGKRHTFCIDEDGKQLDVVVGHIMLSLVGTFPSVPLEKLIVNIDVKPVMRLKEFHDKIPSVQQKALTNPCDNFSMAYQSMCDLFAVEFMEDVAWDIDTIYLSHGTREMNLGDFDHLLDARAMATIVSALEHNRWFTGFNASNVKLSPAAANELVKVLKNNTTLEELVLPCSAIKAELLHRLSLSIAANSGSSLTVLDLSDNIIEDKGVISICMPLTKLGHGLKKLKLSRTGLTAVGVCRVADTLQNNTNMLSTLTHLDLSYNALRGEDITSLYSFLAQPNALTKLMLVSIDSPLENLFATLLRGCTRCLAHLDLSGNYYSSKKQTSKEISVPLTWQQFFSSSCALKIVSFANVRLPAEAVKSVLLGISTNSTLKDVELNLSGNALGNSALQVLEACLPTLRNISVLDLSDNGFDSTLASLIGILSQNRSIRKLALGRNLNNVKQSAVNQTMEALVGLIQIEGSSIEHLVLDDLKLRAETTILINALGLNNSLTHLDISGNQMGDLGARMLSKALQINKKLISVQWDQNGTSPAGFQLIALALEKNYTLKEMPTPLNDATVALKNNQAKTEKALRKMDSLALQIQNSLAKLEKIGKVATETEVVMKQASALLKDADASRQLLLQLEKVAFKAESQESRIGQSLSTYAKDLGDVVERQLKDTASEMVHCAHSHCPVVLETEDQREAVRDACLEEIKLQPCLIQSLVIEQIGTEIFNKTAELNLAIATSLSDRIADDVIILLGSCNEKLITALRREARSGGHLEGNTAESKEMRKVLLRQSTLNSELGDESLDAVNGELPVVNDKRKTMLMRRNRPMSNIDPSDVRKALVLNTAVAAASNAEIKLSVLAPSVESEDVNLEPSGVKDLRSETERLSYDRRMPVESSDAKEVSATAGSAVGAPSSPVPLPRKRKGITSQISTTPDSSLSTRVVSSPLPENKEQDEPKGSPAINKEQDGPKGSPAINKERDRPNGSPAINKERDGPKRSPAINKEQDGPKGSPAINKEQDGPKGLPAINKEQDGPKGSPAINKAQDELKKTPAIHKEQDEPKKHAAINKEQEQPKKPAATNRPAPPVNRLLFEQMRNKEIPESEPVSSEQIPTTPKISSPSVDKQPSSPSVQKKPTTPKVIKSKVDGLDLPVDTEVPKLQYLGADRPRRPKNKAMTRPTVGLDISTSSIVESNSGVVDVGVDDFFSANRDTVASPSSTPVILNGEQENIVTKDQKKLKSQTSKSESKGISGFMKGLMSKVQSGKNSGVVESSPTQPCEGSDIAPNKSPSNTLEKFQNKSPSNTLERSQSKSPSNTLEKGKSPTVQLERGHSFGAGDATKEKAGPVAPTTVPPRPVAVPRYGLPGMSANVINELPKRVKSQTAEDDKPKVDASSAPEGGGKEIVLNSTAGNGRERPIPSRYQPDKPDKEHSASTSSSTSLDKEPSQATQLPALGPKDHSISSYHPVPSSRRLLSTYATDDAKDTLVATVIEDPAKQASAVVDNDEVNVGSRITSVPKAAQRAPPPLAPKPKPKRGTIIEEVPVEGPSKTPSFKAQSSEVEREQLDSQKSVKLVEQSESDADKGEKLDRNSNVKRASDVSIEMDNKEEDEETSETRSQPLPANRLSSLSSTIDSDGGSDSIAHSDSERHSSLEHSISSDSQVDAKNDNVTSAEQADPMQPAFL